MGLWVMDRCVYVQLKLGGVTVAFFIFLGYLTGREGREGGGLEGAGNGKKAS